MLPIKTMRFPMLALALAVPMAVAGCGPLIVPGENTSFHSTLELNAAIGGKNTPVRILGEPFPGTDRAVLERSVLESMKYGGGTVSTNFVPMWGPSDQANYFVVLAFNAAIDVLPSNLCDRTELPSDPNRRPIQLQAAFCGSGPWTTSSGWLRQAAGPEDPEFQNLVFGVTRTLFPTSFCIRPPCF